MKRCLLYNILFTFTDQKYLLHKFNIWNASLYIFAQSCLTTSSAIAAIRISSYCSKLFSFFLLSGAIFIYFCMHNSDSFLLCTSYEWYSSLLIITSPANHERNLALLRSYFYINIEQKRFAHLTHHIEPPAVHLHHPTIEQNNQKKDVLIALIDSLNIEYKSNGSL